MVEEGVPVAPLVAEDEGILLRAHKRTHRRYEEILLRDSAHTATIRPGLLSLQRGPTVAGSLHGGRGAGEGEGALQGGRERPCQALVLRVHCEPCPPTSGASG